jgi:dTDP-4-dehydrorhamnose reductase
MIAMVTGCCGLLGRKLLQYRPSWVYAVGVDVQEPDAPLLASACEYQHLDVTHADAIREALEKRSVDWVVNTAAFTNVDACETRREDCWQINVLAVKALAEVARTTGTRVLQVSSDYVFDGTAGPYAEDDEPAPLGFYGRSKLASEVVLRETGAEYVIVRTNVLYGHAPGVRPNFVHWVLQQLERGVPFRVVSDQVGNPTLADDLAQAIWTLVASEARGTYHLGGSDLLDRRTFALAVAEVFGFPQDLIGEISTAELRQAAPRPLRSGLLWEKARQRFGIRMRGVREGLQLLRAQMLEESMQSDRQEARREAK